MKKSDIFWQTYMNLEKEVIEMAKYIFITDEKIINKSGREIIESCSSQLSTYSPHIADLLIRCCVQIEAISKELYFELNGQKKRGDSTIKFDEDCLKIIDMKWETHNKRVLVVAPFFNLTKDENRVLRPLKEAHKRQGTYWEKAYQAVKHDRYSCLYMGNVRAIIHALAALYLLNVYYRKETWVIRYQDLDKQDFSMGSALFSVLKPKADQLWEGNNPIKSESPFVVSYQDDVYKQIDNIRCKEYDDLNNYWRQQPELQESAFLAQLQEASQKEQRVMQIWELAKYRLNKAIPPTLPFAVRKEHLIKSEAWNCWINQHNKHLEPAEIAEENIQDEINIVGVRWGMEIMKRYQKLEWIPIAMNSGLCRIYIP